MAFDLRASRGNLRQILVAALPLRARSLPAVAGVSVVKFWFGIYG
jgi:hypothetical protein